MNSCRCWTGKGQRLLNLCFDAIISWAFSLDSVMNSSTAGVLSRFYMAGSPSMEFVVNSVITFSLEYRNS